MTARYDGRNAINAERATRNAAALAARQADRQAAAEQAAKIATSRGSAIARLTSAAIAFVGNHR